MSPENNKSVYKQAYGKSYTPITKAYKRDPIMKNRQRKKVLKGILKHTKEGQTPAKKLSKSALKVVRFSFKDQVQTEKNPRTDTPLSQEGLRRSPRLEKSVDGFRPGVQVELSMPADPAPGTITMEDPAPDTVSRGDHATGNISRGKVVTSLVL